MNLTFEEFLKQREEEKLIQWRREAKAEYEQQVMEYERQKQLKREAVYGKNPNYSGIRVIGGVPYKLGTNRVSEVTTIEPICTKEQFYALTGAERNELYETNKAIFMKLNNGYPLEPDFEFMARAHGDRLENIDYKQNAIDQVKEKYGWNSSEYEPLLSDVYDNLGENGFKIKFSID